MLQLRRQFKRLALGGRGGKIPLLFVFLETTRLQVSKGKASVDSTILLDIAGFITHGTLATACLAPDDLQPCRPANDQETFQPSVNVMQHATSGQERGWVSLETRPNRS
jgi:hypothetical protein